MIRTVVGFVTAFAFALVLGIAPGADACEPVHTLKREPPTEGKLCWTGPCKKTLGAIQELGRFSVARGNEGKIIDHIVMEVETEHGLEVLVDSRTGASCNPPAPTVTGCTGIYKLDNIEACPLGTAPCANADETHPSLTLDQVNQGKTKGGVVTLSDGQEIAGQGGRRFWLYYETCCPDLGQFGGDGDELITSVRYVLVDPDGNPQSCEEKDARTGERPDEIPAGDSPPCP